MKLLQNLFLLAVGLPIYAAPFNLNFTGSVGGDTVAYTGDQNNWVSVACGSNPGSNGYNYCQGELLGNLLPGPTRASVISPSMPFSSLGYQVDFMNAQNQVVAILGVNPSAGCSGGSGTVTCGVEAILLNSLTGGALSSSTVSSFSSIPVAGTVTVTGANQTALVLDWSDGRSDNLNVQIAGQATPEPATLGFVSAALLPLWLFRRRLRKA